MKPKYTNSLIKESSPYLLQHAHNPVDWKPWNEETLDDAKSNNKLILISIGYAACHWCHVMEHETFEDKNVATTMNQNFVNIKVDREERPDIDQIYMNAVQLLTGGGGWPLNVVALPDGRPFWGGTYFKKDQWQHTLSNIAKIYQENPQKLIDYTENLSRGIQSMDFVKTNPEDFNLPYSTLSSHINDMTVTFDFDLGGHLGEPKFMMPNQLHFLLREAYQNNNTDLQEYVNTTLIKMANGGLYDQIGGGFSRYSVDKKWHIPHFEKMLYDNAQLVSLYSDAYLITERPLYKSVVQQTLEFISRELTNDEGIFYSALDADSINNTGILEEGAYYVWTKPELQSLLKDDFELFSSYYNINDYGYWEEENYVLIKLHSDETFCNKHQITLDYLNEKLDSWQTLLLEHRSQRPQPRLDDKSLTSWNALMLKAYVDAYRVFNNATYLNSAIRNANFIINKQLKGDGSLFHSYKNGKSTINGFLEDYAFTVEAFISLYEITFEEKWLYHARDLVNYTFDYFYNEDNQMFYFTSSLDPELISRHAEYLDNVNPSSNSVMAKNLFKLSHLLGNQSYYKASQSMLNNMSSELIEHATYYSNWMDLALNFSTDFFEIAIVGENSSDKLKELNRHYIPNKVISVSKTESQLALLKNRFQLNKTLLYICVNNSCQRPVEQVEDALKQIT